MSKLFSALNELKTNIFGGQSYVRTDTPGSSNGVNILRKSNIEMLERSPTSRLDNDPLAFSTVAYPHDIVADGTNGHYMLFYVNVQNQTKFAANYKTPAGLTVEEKVAGQNYGAEQMAAGQAPARSFTKEQALLEGKGTSLSNVKELKLTLKVHQAYKLVTIRQLSQLDWLAADYEVIKKLQSKYY